MNYALTPEQKKTLQDAIQEISNSMIRTEAERDLIREIVKDQSDTLQIPKKVISKIAKTYFCKMLSHLLFECLASSASHTFFPMG